MGKNSHIEWTTHSWNPWRGCIKVSPGCKHCYMYREQTRYGLDPRAIRRTTPRTFGLPFTWHDPAFVFTCSWSDFFLAEADAWRDDAWGIVRRTPHLTYQLLTKRPEHIAARLPADWGSGWPHVWLGVSVERAAYLPRLDVLRQIPAAVRFISYEPALGPVDFAPHLDGFSWLIAGGESGPKARPADLDWFRHARDVCQAAGVAFFLKQHGGTRRISGVWGGCLLDGAEHKHFPEVSHASAT